MSQISILETILKAMDENGVLPKDFVLPAENETQAKFAPGGMDGVLMFHAKPNNPVNTESFGKLTSAIVLASGGNMEEAHKLVDDVCSKEQYFPMVEAIQKFAYDKQDILNEENLMTFARDLFSKGTKREEVKFGLSLMELFETDDIPELKDFVRKIAVCDEFTLFAIYVMSSWTESNKEIFELAKKVYGWGRIFAVLFLEAENKEIVKWMITEGVKNKILPNYSALGIAVKCDIVSLMEEPVTLEEFFGIVGIVGLLLDEKAVRGISAVNDPNKLIDSFDKFLITNIPILQKDMTRNQKIYINEVVKARMP